ncbi:MAG: HIT domain-containing protein [Bacteroidetes bacterium]|nr:HIT domain-containing protein [Bacteroidota bacterium]
MERLFSPWRSKYIASFKNQKNNDECIFCKALNSKNDKKNLILFRSKNCFAMLNLYPYNNGHIMIVPNKHVDSLSLLPAKVYSEILSTINKTIKLLDKAIKPQGYNIGANFGRVAGAGIENHIHFHIVPRWNGDTNFMPVLNDVKLVSEGFNKTYQKLISALKKTTRKKK